MPILRHCVLQTGLIFFVILGQIVLHSSLRQGPDIEEELFNERDPGEPPPDLFKKQSTGLNSLPSSGERYKCHSCEPPSCSSQTICHDAVQCWKSRVRESTGKDI